MIIRIVRTGEKAQLIMGPIVEIDHLSLFPKTHMVEREN